MEMTDLEKPDFVRCMIEGLIILMACCGKVFVVGMAIFFGRGGGWGDFYMMWSWFLRQPDEVYALAFMLLGIYIVVVLVLRHGPESEKANLRKKGRKDGKFDGIC